MFDDPRLLGAFALSLVTVLLVTPIAIRIAARTQFHDHPAGFKAHLSPTPYLGGAAVITGFLVAAAIFGDGLERFAPILACALILWVVGTFDDRNPLGVLPRLLVEGTAALLLWRAGLGWNLFDHNWIDFVLTVGWVIAIVNAFNLMDNIDGAVGTVAGASALGVGALAMVRDDPVLAALAFSLGGACFGFLRYNLASPARIFLGDGGSMPIGFVLASLIMSIPVTGNVGRVPLGMLLSAALLVGLPLLDTTLVIVSRRRRGVPLLTGGVDHLTHRLRALLPSARALALVLLLAQAALCAAAIGVVELPRNTIYPLLVVCAVLWAFAVTTLEMLVWSPDGTPTASQRRLTDRLERMRRVLRARLQALQRGLGFARPPGR